MGLYHIAANTFKKQQCFSIDKPLKFHHLLFYHFGSSLLRLLGVPGVLWASSRSGFDLDIILKSIEKKRNYDSSSF